MAICFEKEPKDFSMNLDEMELALNKSQLQTTRLEKFPASPTKNMLVECRHKTKHYWHYIVYDAEQQTFLDPIPVSPPINEYKFYRVIEV